MKLKKKFDIALITIFVLVALIACIVFTAFSQTVFADNPEETPVFYFGNCQPQMTKIADMETQRFMEALNGTINEFFGGDENKKRAFANLLKVKTGLGDYVLIETRSPEEIEALERLRRDMRPFVDGDAKFEAMAPALELISLTDDMYENGEGEE